MRPRAPAPGRLLTYSELQEAAAFNRSITPSYAQVLRVPARDSDPFDAALSLTVLPVAARRIVPRQQQRTVVIRIIDSDSRRRTERRAGL